MALTVDLRLGKHDGHEALDRRQVDPIVALPVGQHRITSRGVAMGDGSLVAAANDVACLSCTFVFRLGVSKVEAPTDGPVQVRYSTNSKVEA